MNTPSSLTATIERREALLREIMLWLDDPKMQTWQYMEGSYFYSDKELFRARIQAEIGGGE